jgi:oligo-1,6-glucosidase
MQEMDGNSCLQYFKRLVSLRKAEKALVYGKYTLLDAGNQQVYAYTREWQGKQLLVLLNFSDKPATANTGINTANAKALIHNYSTAPSATLRPYEAVIYAL